MWFDCAAVSDSPPRHLAPRRQGRAVRSRRWLYAGGLALVLAAGVAVAVTVTRGDDSQSIVSELTGRSPSTPGATATTSPPTTATAPAPSEPPRPVQRTPGNLLANGDFELDLSGWRPTGGAQVDRVAVGHSGAWSVRIDAGWHEVAVVHEVQAGGRLTVEAMAGNLRPGEAFLVDQVSIAAA